MKIPSNFYLTKNKNAFYQILNNLITNAVDAIKNEGSIKITYEKSSNIIKISDTGTGINQNDLNNVFDAFYTTKNIDNKNHIGLGLYIVKNLIIKLGWEIRSVFKPQIETSFIISVK